MTAREIIIKLVDEGKITGEEAFILIDATKPNIVYQPYEIKPYDKYWWESPPYTITANNTNDISYNYSVKSVKPGNETCDN